MVNSGRTRDAGWTSGLVLAALALGLVGLAACGKDDDKKDEPAAAPTFASVSSIFTSDCGTSGCHNGTTATKFEESNITKARATSALAYIALAPSDASAMPPSSNRGGVTTAYDKSENGIKMKAYLDTIK